jgi:hypothetical protein
MRSTLIARFILSVLLASVCLHAAETAQVALLPIEGVRAFLRFDPGLVKSLKPHPACHIFYEPTLNGFRASADNAPIRELNVSVNPMSFVVGRSPVGDSWNIADAILRRLPQSIALTISIDGNFPPQVWREAAERRFPAGERPVRPRASGTRVAHPWSQDHLKAGYVGDELRILVPRRLFEGRGSDGDVYRPLLAELVKDRFVPSKLSWEGGDLQFVADPRDPSRTLLFHGGAARDYWGAMLNPADYSYVLAAEFGADEAVDLSSVGPHADYLVAFLPQDGTALVSQTVQSDPQLIESAVKALAEIYGERSPARLRALAGRLADWDRDIHAYTDFLRAEFSAIGRDLRGIAPDSDRKVGEELAEYAEQYCPGSQQECITEPHAPEVFERAPDLLRRVADQVVKVKLESELGPRLLALAESQLADVKPWKLAEMNRVAARLQKLGFNVVRIPYAAAPAQGSTWPGVGYANMLVHERKLFVPSLGLGEFETRLYENLGKKLRNRYEVIPVDARSGLVGNGGVHCVFGIVREPVQVEKPTH